MENADIKSAIAELKAVRTQLTVWRSSLFIVALIVVIVCLFSLLGAVNGLAKPGPGQQQFTSEFGSRMQKDVVPQLKSVAQELVKTIDINKKVADLNKRAPEVANAGMKEARQLSEDLPNIGQKILSEEFQAALDGRMSTLKKEFPEADEATLKQVMEALIVETQNQISEVTGSLFMPRIDTMNGIIGDIDKIVAGEGAAGKADMPTLEMAFTITDIMRADLQEAGKLPADKPAPKSAPKSGK